MAEKKKKRSGRLSNDERLQILNELGRVAKGRFNQYLFFGAGGYNLRLLMDSLKWYSDPNSFKNEYYIDTGNDELNKIAKYFEYGTGIHNTQLKSQHYITPKSGKYMKFVGTHKFTNMIIFTKIVKGVRPVMMLQKTKKSMEFDDEYLKSQARMRLGI